jgi:predicted RNA binding protein YcfA (HicA-like mRNA interferase family)
MNEWTNNLVGLVPRKRCKEVGDLLRDCQDRGGWIGRRTASSHVMLRHVSGKYVTVATTPSDWHSTRNTRAAIRRAEAGK